MKIVITGGGTGGHFFPAISILEEIACQAQKNKIIVPDFYYLATNPYRSDILEKNNIKFIKVYSAKLKRPFVLSNLFLPFKIFYGLLKALINLYKIYPNVIFSNGGYDAFPTLLAARILRIPVFIHISDVVPSTVCLSFINYADKITIAFEETKKYLNINVLDKVFLVGNPIRKEIDLKQKSQKEDYNYFGFKEDLPIIFILGGSLGAQNINNKILDILPKLVDKFQIIHQTGFKNIDDVINISNLVLRDNSNISRYRAFPFLDGNLLNKSMRISSLIISRGGAGSIYEISSFNLPSIVIPISPNIVKGQRENALAYTKTGASILIDNDNLSGNLLFSELERLFNNPDILFKMRESAKNFYKINSASVIAEGLLNKMINQENLK